MTGWSFSHPKHPPKEICPHRLHWLTDPWIQGPHVAEGDVLGLLAADADYVDDADDYTDDDAVVDDVAVDVEAPFHLWSFRGVKQFYRSNINWYIPIIKVWCILHYIQWLYNVT